MLLIYDSQPYMFYLGCFIVLEACNDLQFLLATEDVTVLMTLTLVLDYYCPPSSSEHYNDMGPQVLKHSDDYWTTIHYHH